MLEISAKLVADKRAQYEIPPVWLNHGKDA